MSAISSATPFKPADERADGEETADGGTISESNLDDNDGDMENWLSVAKRHTTPAYCRVPMAGIRSMTERYLADRDLARLGSALRPGWFIHCLCHEHSYPRTHDWICKERIHSQRPRRK